MITTSSSGPPEGNDPEPSSPGPERSVEASASDSKDSPMRGSVSPDTRPGLPSGLNILWSPEAQASSSATSASAIPSEEDISRILTNYHVTLHPQTQHRAVYASASGPPTEPTLALYCPIEGGDYILDATVRELGLRAGADVVVIDAAQLAAGEHGHFGKGMFTL